MAKIALTIVVWILRIGGYAVLTICAVVAILGVLRGGTDWRYAAQLALEIIGPAIFLILVVGAALAWWRLYRKRHAFTAIVAGVATIAVIACGYTLAGYLGVANARGVAIDFARTLWPESAPSDDAVERVVYDQYEGEEQTLYIHRPDAQVFQGPRPILVHIHGGGWVQGGGNARLTDQTWFARQGYLAISVDYALSSERRHLWDVVEPQLGCALSWIAANAERLGGDPERIAIYGESAGGNLVLNLAHLGSSDRLVSSCGGETPQIAATISIYPPVDLAATYEHPPARRFGQAYIGGSPGEYPERYATLSPMTNVAAAAPPTLVLVGEDDSLVPVGPTLRYVEQSRAAGNEIDLIALPRAGHAFDVAPGSITNQIFRQSALGFLRDNGLQP